MNKIRRYLFIFSVAFLFFFRGVEAQLPDDPNLKYLRPSYCPATDLNKSSVDYQGLYTTWMDRELQNTAAGFPAEVVHDIEFRNHYKQEAIKQWASDCQNNSNEGVDETPGEPKSISFTPEVGIPGFRSEVEVSGALIGDFLVVLFRYLIYLSGIVAVLAIILAGFQWVLAGGNQSKIGEAKSRLQNALIGFVLCVSSVLILQTINPALLNIVPIKVEKIIPIEVDRYELASSGSYIGSGSNIKSVGDSHIFSEEVIVGIQKSAKWNNIDECIYYAVIHQESGGDPRAFGNDSAVTRDTACDIIARRAHICNLYPSCCKDWLAGKINSNKRELCNNPNCSKYVYDKNIPGVSISNWKNYINKKGYTFGLGLGQITYHSKQDILCNNNNGFIYQNKCFSFDSLLTIDSNLEAFVLGWKHQYCKDGNLELCFRRYAGGTTSQWAISTGNLKLARYNKCKELGFENIARKGIGR